MTVLFVVIKESTVLQYFYKMSLSLDEYIDNLGKFLNIVSDELPVVMSEGAVSMKTEIQNRIQEQGLDDQNNPLQYGSGTPYSEKDIPAFFYKNAETLNAGATSYVDEQIESGEGISYKDWREANNLQTDHVDLTFTGNMWKRIGLTSVKTGQNIAIVTIEGRTDEAQEKLFFNSVRYGDILQPNKDELDELEFIVDTRLQNLATKYL